MDAEDVLGDSIGLFGDERTDDDTVSYGPLTLTTAPKEGKANTLLADHLFSPSLLLAERIERGLVPLKGTTVVELGAGCALPSLLSATLSDPPSLVVITDYPDDTIMGNLQSNVSRNRASFTPSCSVHAVGFEWGRDVAPLLAYALYVRALLPAAAGTPGFDVVVLSDLLHFDASHDVLLAALTSLLRPSPDARTYVAAGKYTPAAVCTRFLHAGEALGLVWEEGEDDPVWRGSLEVRGGGLDAEQLGVRKGMCRWWVGRWASSPSASS